MWTDQGRELAQYYGAAASEDALFARRVTVVLDADGKWLLTYTLGFTGLYAHAGDVLADCQKLFESRP